MRFAPNVVPDEETKEEKFRQGLNPRIQTVVSGHENLTLQACYNCASRIEMSLQSRGILGGEKRKAEEKATSGGNPKESSFQKKKQKLQPDSRPDQQINVDQKEKSTSEGSQRRKNKRRFFCKICRRDHPGVDCDGNAVKCYYCHKMGHRAYECFDNPESASYKGARGDSGEPVNVAGSSRGVSEGSGGQGAGNGHPKRIVTHNGRA